MDALDFDIADNEISALVEWRNALGDANVSENVSEFSVDTSALKIQSRVVLRPQTSSQVADIVIIANRFKTPVYPVSTGRNWGYGSSLPPMRVTAIVDLSSMDQIIDFDSELGIATIEPGVTQAKLHDYLRRNRFQFLVPVTGAGPDCSILGNALERGFGLTPVSDHSAAILSLEAVLPNGSVYRSAFRRSEGAGMASPYRWGSGPNFDGMFAQSGMGIVLNVSIALARVPDRVGAFAFSLNSDDDLMRIIDPVREIMATTGGGIGGINLISRERVNAMLVGGKRVESAMAGQSDHSKLDYTSTIPGSWIGFGSLYGTELHYRATKTTLKRRLAPPVLKLRFFDQRRVAGLRWVDSLLVKLNLKNEYRALEQLKDSLNLLDGIPSRVALRLAYSRSGSPPRNGVLNPARDGCGLFWYSPIVPMRTEAVSKFVEMARRICKRHGFEAPVTLTCIEYRYVSATVPILFRPDDAEQVQRATDCYTDLLSSGGSNGFYPYRIGAQFMQSALDRNHPHWRLGASVKAALDPEMIISPGRYSRLEW